ncbi:MAG: RluA family pseudouridine synthase [Alphaproteobacteria bacterium]|nr:RluA family pseudouridine synthase [Alphaproteobacteria bacterium]
MTDESYRFVVDAGQEGGRLDKVLAALETGLSRSRIQGLIEQGRVLVNGKPVTTASKKITTGDEVEISIPPPEPAEPAAQDIPLDIVYEDGDLLVINKPAGLVVHPGAGNREGTLVNALLHHCGESLSGIGGVARPGIVHRLDKDTSGLMIVAKHDKAHRGLAEQLESRTLKRVYKALVLKTPFPAKGVVDKPIGRHPGSRVKMAVREKSGKTARTLYKVEESYGGAAALVECTLESGRTHQIRVHMASIGHPLVGDPVYGAQANAVESALRKAGFDKVIIDKLLSFPRQALHAGAISFVHPVTEKPLSFTAKLPADINKLLKLLDK